MPHNAGDDHDDAKHVADLRAVLEVSRALGATLELDPLLQLVEQAALRVLECDRASVFLFDEPAGQLYSRLATGVEGLRFDAARGIAGEVVRTGRIVNVPDAYADPRFNREIDRQTGYRTRNILAFPLVGLDNRIVGVLQVLNKAAGSFDPWDEDLVRVFGAQVGVALQRHMLLQEYAEKQRIQRDLSIARDIQRSLLPGTLPQAAGFDLAAWNNPADETGGDCFDFLELPGGDVAFLIADATGHGIGPALISAECRALFRATASLTHDLLRVVGRVNDLLCQDLPSDRFVTAFFGFLSPKDGTLSFVSAGQGPLLHYCDATGTLAALNANAPPLGITPNMPLSAAAPIILDPGDLFILLTDGFFEWANERGELFGVERTREVVLRHRRGTAAELIEAIHAAVRAFGPAVKQADDLTAIVVKRTVAEPK